jgi:ABC-type branched-subunit amino acid transport system ATPase component/ABC-type branched-subunit amino acid transport system permease subunit
MEFTLVILTFVGFQVILSLGLNLQWGVAGMLNLAYIGFMAAGAYTTAVLVLPKATLAGAANYILGLQWPFWAGMLGGIAAAGALALVVGFVVLGRRLEAEYFAILTLVVVIALSTVLSTQANLFNGIEGLINVPQPFGQQLTTTSYGTWFLLMVAAFAVVVYLLAHRVQRSPFGRLGRAVREDETALQVFGKDPFRAKLKIFVLGAMIAGLAGSLTVLYVGAFAPASWAVGETVFALSCVMVGGSGSMLGGALASAVIVTLFVQVPSLVHVAASNPEVLAEVQVMATAILLIAVMRWRPDGLLREPVGSAAKLAGRGGLAAAAAGAAGERPAVSEASVASQPAAVTPAPVVSRPPEISEPPLVSQRAVAAAAAGPAAQAALELRGVTKRFGGITAVDDCSFRLPAGGIVGLVGPNGSGKSTIVEIVSGFQAPDRGQVLFGGRDVTGWPPSRRAAAGLTRTFQSARVWSRLTVTENLLVAAPGSGREALWRGVLRPRATARADAGIVGKAEQTLHETGLWPVRDQLAGELSGGQKRLLEFARIVMSGATLALLDEPLAGVNPVMGDTIVEQIRQLNSVRGVTVLLVEHNLKVVSALCPLVLAMDAGKIVAQGTVQSLASSRSFAEAYLGKRAPKTPQE